VGLTDDFVTREPGHFPTLALRPTTHPLFQQYEERLIRRGATESTLSNFRNTAARFGESGLDPMTATDVDIEEWLAGLRVPRTKGDGVEVTSKDGRRKGCLSARTVRLHKENLSAAYNYAVHRRILPASPVEAVRLPREPDKEPRILTNGELRHILGNCITDEQELLITTLAYTGMRRSEIRHLRWEDIAPTTITVREGKGGKLRHVPLHPALSELIVRHEPKPGYVFPGRNGALRSESSFFYILEKVRGAVFCTMHDFRRTVATQLAEHEVPNHVIDKIMGWAPRTVGSRYYIRTADLRMQEAILRLYSDDPISVRG
jgi:integrase